MRGGGGCRNPREGWTRRGSRCAGAHDSAAAGFSEATETTIFKVDRPTEHTSRSGRVALSRSPTKSHLGIWVWRGEKSRGKCPSCPLRDFFFRSRSSRENSTVCDSTSRRALCALRPFCREPSGFCRFEASRERGDLARGAATTPLHATRVRAPRRFPERVTSLARPRHARRVRRAPGAARRRAGSPRGASDQRPQPPSAARRSRTRVAPLGGRARRDDARRESSPTRRSAVVVASPARPRGRAARRGGHNPQSRLRARRAARRFVRRGGWRFLLDRPSNRRRLERAETK